MSYAQLVPVCGNSAVETGETCDDGNTTSGDGCSSACADETVDPSDPGGCCSTGRTDPRGAMLLGLGSALLVLRRRRRA